MSMLLSAVAGQGGVRVPGAPGTLSLSNGSTSGTMIDLSWSAPSDTGGGTISGYKIERSTNSGGSWSDLVADTGSTGTTYTNTGLTRLTRYDYRVSAINEKGTGAVGNEPYHTTTAELPSAPGTLSLAAGSPAVSAINLSWSAPSDDGGATITGYRIKKDGSTLVADTGSSGTTYTATGLTASTSYNFNVAAINSIGTGADGNTPSLTTGAYPVVSGTSGGVETTSGDYKSWRFTASGSLTFSTGGDVDCLIQAGGGAGGPGNHSGNYGNGGGGAGGQKVVTLTVTTGAKTVTIGNGAAAANLAAGNGGGSTFDTDGATGGGGGGGWDAFSSYASNGGNGGSGGGGRGALSPYGPTNPGTGVGGEGYAGGARSGYTGGGGGGAAAVGTTSGGGNGLANTYDLGGTTTGTGGGGGGNNKTASYGTGGTYGGGAGGIASSPASGAGADGQGGGGGANTSSWTGAGGKGVVVVKYKFQ